MSIQREEITIKEFTSGTTLVYFSTHLLLNTDISKKFPDAEFVPTIVELNNFNQPTKLSTFNGNNIWTLNEDNNYVPTSAVSENYLTGYSFVNDVSQLLRPESIDSIKSSFSESMDFVYAAASATTPKIDYVFPTFQEIDDFYVNISLKRTFSTLDTLNIYNNLINSLPVQNAKTGVVFGRLMALQTIKDSEGNNIRIPLRNVPVGIFNPSNDYPTPASVSDNGDRIFLNIKETVENDEYFNEESFNFDKTQLLRSASQFTTVPEHYRYITTTNDEGEFVIYDAPLGTQLIMFEVDLLKQGLTRDEIALNFFPFPPDNDAMIDQIPNFSFKQFPINVVPAWGTIQTGYTELDVVVNIDLRKWTTYFIPPVSVGGLKLESSVASSAANSLKIEFRNMAKEGYPKTNIKMTTIPNDLDRVFGQQLNWNLEFAQVRNYAEFFKFGISGIKLPANIYDPNGYRTNKDGVPMERPSQKGVWLSAYQLKISSNSASDVSRMSGSYRQDSTNTYSHFNLTYSDDNIASLDSSTESINKFPYEKPWSIEYPNKYSIPKKPTQERFTSYTNGRTETSPGSGLYFLQEPSFSDGDMVGNIIDGKAGGFGVMPYSNTQTFNIWIPNRIAHAITKNYMYKYESDVAINETYSNGYEPSNPNFDTLGTTSFVGQSSVIGGEKYQRLECGYGYFCRPDGWPRVARYDWGEEGLFKADVSYGTGLGGSVTTPRPSSTTSLYSNRLWSGKDHRNDVYNIQTQEIALSIDKENGLGNAGIDFFRVIDTSIENLTPIEPFVIPTFIKLHTSHGQDVGNSGNGAGKASRVYDVQGQPGFMIRNRGEIDIIFKYWLAGNGSYPVVTPLGTHTAANPNIKLRPGDFAIIYGGGPFPIEQALQYTTIQALPGNANFNTTTNRYDSAYYDIYVTYFNKPFPLSLVKIPLQKSFPLRTSTGITPPEWWCKTMHIGGNNGNTSPGLNTNTKSVSGTFLPFAEAQYLTIENNPNPTQT